MKVALRRFVTPKNAPATRAAGAPGSHPGRDKSKLARMQEIKNKSAGKLGESTEQEAQWSYSSSFMRPSTAEWQPKRYDFAMDFKARWPYT